MIVKLNDRIINLDLVKEVSEITAYLVNEKRDGNSGYIHIIRTKKDIVRWLDISNTGTESQQEYEVIFGFQIFYLEEKYPKHVKVSLHQSEARKAREAFATLLNNNNPVIHEVKW